MVGQKKERVIRVVVDAMKFSQDDSKETFDAYIIGLIYVINDILYGEPIKSVAVDKKNKDNFLVVSKSIMQIDDVVDLIKKINDGFTVTIENK